MKLSVPCLHDSYGWGQASISLEDGVLDIRVEGPQAIRFKCSSEEDAELLEGILSRVEWESYLTEKI